MIVEKIVVGDLETNCYLAFATTGADEVLVIDPGDDAEKILDRIAKRNVAAVLLTHGHFDHTGALSAFRDVPIYIHAKDAPMLRDNRLSVGELMGDKAARPAATHHMKEGEMIELAGLKLRVMETPGHTMGSVCLICDNQVFTGDTLFDGDYGRTDLPGGSATLMRASLKRIFELQGHRAYPGHGGETSIK
ncbi:MAG: MBL fold metallo-hydrolase [Eubacteriales bacterium]|jgi:glyoxylase-like metal-dependent hydrolase (beta-lactamase superfamily II)|nr:MBL fold metallo-hydrolase [Eubacteriales bacterium]MDD4104322.1 MBL fold metallo-hydrolase [Eubacteriales bacterium]MDD4709731.1 MBL fold metallo-hydrolase [Eubacteriales bacterium]NLO16091.1 MBL fold metallo-hydrolase [Clostridiales bacterium]